MNNYIENVDKEISIGYHKDFMETYKKLIKEALDKNDVEEASRLMEEMTEIDATHFADDDGDHLYRLSENNGMGFSCERIFDAHVIAQQIETVYKRAGGVLKTEPWKEVIKWLQEYGDERGL